MPVAPVRGMWDRARPGAAPRSRRRARPRDPSDENADLRARIVRVGRDEPPSLHPKSAYAVGKRCATRGDLFPECHFGPELPKLWGRITEFGLPGSALIGFTAQIRFGVLLGLAGNEGVAAGPGGGFRQRSRSMR